MSIATPCTKVCTLHPLTGFCIGCGRTGDEIAAWTSFTEAERGALMAVLPARPGAAVTESATDVAP